MRMKYARKLSIFLCRGVQQTLFFLSPAETLSMPECFYVKTAVFELVQQFYHATEIGNVANAVSPRVARSN